MVYNTNKHYKTSTITINYPLDSRNWQYATPSKDLITPNLYIFISHKRRSKKNSSVISLDVLRLGLLHHRISRFLERFEHHMESSIGEEILPQNAV